MENENEDEDRLCPFVSMKKSYFPSSSLSCSSLYCFPSRGVKEGLLNHDEGVVGCVGTDWVDDEGSEIEAFPLLRALLLLLKGSSKSCIERRRVKPDRPRPMRVMAGFGLMLSSHARQAISLIVRWNCILAISQACSGRAIMAVL